MIHYITTERPNLFEPNVYISMIVKIKSKSLAPQQIKTAIEMAYTANEATMSQIVIEDNGNAYYKKLATSGCKV